MTTKLLIGAAALICAIALPIASVSAAQPNFSFGFSVGEPPPGPPPYHPGFGPGPHYPPPPPPRYDRCESPRHIMDDLADQGYSRFVPVDKDRHTFTIDARRNFKWYELTVDNCTGDILDRERIFRP
jgi:hypothetical protein